MGAGTGHRRRGAEEFRENSQTTEYAAYGAKHRCRARSARGDGEWNERSPLVFNILPPFQNIVDFF